MIVSQVLIPLFYFKLRIFGLYGLVFGWKLQDEALQISLSIFILGHLLFNFLSSHHWIFIMITPGIYVFSLGMLLAYSPRWFYKL